MLFHNSYILSKYSSKISSENLDFRMKLAMFLSNYKQIEIQRMDIDSIELKKGEINSCHLCKNCSSTFYYCSNCGCPIH